ncbi:hypothetical protein ACHAW6_003449, partial [Cyclotella cf. meneghiniana]
KADSSPSFICTIRQKITGWFSPSDDANTDLSKNFDSQPLESSTADVKPDVRDVPPRSRPLTAYELFVQSPTVRRIVLDQMDPALHQDEEFFIHRREGCWQEIMAEDSIFKSRGSHDGRNGDDDDDDVNSNRSSSKNIMTYAYWVSMEEKDRQKFQREQQRNKNIHSKPGVSVARGMSLAAWTRSSRNQRDLPPIYFHYMYINHDNHVATAIEKKRDGKCPFCTFYGKTNEDLLYHCGVVHGVLTDYYPWEELKYVLFFQEVFDEDKNMHVVVRSSSNSFEDITAHAAHDFTFLRTNPSKEITHQSIRFLRHSHPNIAAMDPIVRRRHLLALEANDAPVSVIASYLPTDEVPICQYFHSRTNLPMEDWNDVDSDDESDDDWLHKMSSDLMEEFEDVSRREKTCMQLWNRCIFRHVVIADRDIPGKCHEFIERHRMELKRGT